MVDGSDMSFYDNSSFVKSIAEIVHSRGGSVEAELGKLSGSGEGKIVDILDERQTNPDQVAEYAEMSNVDFLAACIGNVHGKYKFEPKLDFKRLEKISNEISIPIVLHGASGLSDEAIKECIQKGVRKINVNSDTQAAYKYGLKKSLSQKKIRFQM